MTPAKAVFIEVLALVIIVLQHKGRIIEINHVRHSFVAQNMLLSFVIESIVADLELKTFMFWSYFYCVSG